MKSRDQIAKELTVAMGFPIEELDDCDRRGADYVIAELEKAEERACERYLADPSVSEAVKMFEKREVEGTHKK